MNDTSDKTPEGCEKIDDRKGKEGEDKEERVTSRHRAAKGCLIGFVSICVLFAATCVAVLDSGQADREPLSIDQDAVLAEMKGAFESGITRVEVSGSSNSIRVDVHTNLSPNQDIADVALGMSLIAVQSNEIVTTYPSSSITAYVWPHWEEFYLTRASASYTGGKLNGAINSYTNSALR